jgi:hypothetical protein
MTTINKGDLYMIKQAHLTTSDAASDAVLPLARRCSYSLAKQFALLLCVAEQAVKRFSKPLASFSASRLKGFCALGVPHTHFILRGGGTNQQLTGRCA